MRHLSTLLLLLLILPTTSSAGERRSSWWNFIDPPGSRMARHARFPNGARGHVGPIRYDVRMPMSNPGCDCDPEPSMLDGPQYYFEYIDPSLRQKFTDLSSGNFRIDTNGSTTLRLFVAPARGTSVRSIRVEYGQRYRVTKPADRLLYNKEAQLDGLWFAFPVSGEQSAKVTIVYNVRDPDYCEPEISPDDRRPRRPDPNANLMRRVDCIWIGAYSVGN